MTALASWRAALVAAVRVEVRRVAGGVERAAVVEVERLGGGR